MVAVTETFTYNASKVAGLSPADQAKLPEMPVKGEILDGGGYLVTYADDTQEWYDDRYQFEAKLETITVTDPILGDRPLGIQDVSDNVSKTGRAAIDNNTLINTNKAKWRDDNNRRAAAAKLRITVTT